MEIRQAKQEDAKEIININIKSWIETYKEIFPDAFLKSLNEKKDETIIKCENKIDEYIVAVIDNKVIGFSRIGPNKKGYSNDYAEIYALYVDKEYKRQGIGTKLVKYSFSILSNKYKYCLISTLKDNSANAFYKKLGGKFIKQCKFNIMNNNYIENIYEFEIKMSF